MKAIRTLVIILFLISACAYGGLRVYDEFTADETCPEITCDTDTLEVSVEDPEEKLLEGVTAVDNKDGDLTSEIVVESMGPFLSDGSRRITYVVCDNSNNTSRVSRTLTYSDYKSPRFSISQILRFPENKELDILEYLTAEDVLDGNVTNKIRCTKGYIYSKPSAGIYELGYQVSNSAGDVSNIDVTVEIYEQDTVSYTPAIQLSEYVVYIKKGRLFNPYQYLEKVTVGSRTFAISTASDEESAEEGENVSGLFGDLSNKDTDDRVIESLHYSDIHVDNPVKVEETGTYKVTYTIITADGYTGTTSLSVIVYEMGLHQFRDQFSAELPQHIGMIGNDQNLILLSCFVGFMQYTGSAFHYTVTFQHRYNGSKEALYINHRSQFFQIITVQRCFFLNFQFIPTMNLCPACKPRFDLMNTIAVPVFN